MTLSITVKNIKIGLDSPVQVRIIYSRFRGKTAPGYGIFETSQTAANKN